ncbi:MAG: hypothetical protein HYR92_05935 [Burkholderiales bacterium]|nr:hypothetical protein [Burkholderiales bacterium]
MKMLQMVCIFSCCMACADPSLAQSKVYTVGVEDLEYYPQYSHRGDEYTGFGRELLDAFAKSKGYMFENDSFVSLLKQAQLKRVDGAYINIEVAKYQLKEVLHQPGSLVFDPDLPHTKDYYYLSSVKHPKIIQEFNAFLDKEVALYEGIRLKLKIESSIHEKK